MTESQPNPSLDGSQRAVLDVAAGDALVVVGAPGSGKTTTLVELLAHRVASGVAGADEVLALVPGRTQATALRDRIAARLGGTVSGSRARTPQSLAFEVVREFRTSASRQAPALVTGADDDALIRELVDGHDDPAAHYGFESPITNDVLRLSGFRAELRDLKTTMNEYDVTPDELASYAEHKPAWRGAARLIDELSTVLSWERDGAFDVPGLLLEAASILHTEPVTGSMAVDRLRLVVVDDAQELTEASRRLLVALEARGVTIVTFGDPDIATGVFRGGGAERAVGWRPDGEAAPRRLLLSSVHRHPDTVRDLVSAVVGRIGVRGEGRHRSALSAVAHPGVTNTGVANIAVTNRAVTNTAVTNRAVTNTAVTNRAVTNTAVTNTAIANTAVTDEAAPEAAVGDAATASSGDVRVQTALAENPVAEARLIASLLRRWHLEHGVAWNDMAVLVRSGASVPTLARLLARSEVPTGAVRAPDAAADPAVIAIVGIAGIVADPATLTGDAIESLLSSPLFGVDGLRIRQLRRALRLRERIEGGGRTPDDLLVEAVLAPAGAVGLEAPTDAAPDATGLSLPARHPAVVGLRRFAALLRRATEVATEGAADEVLWAIWEGAGVAERWRMRALRGGTAGEAADARLDAVVALFDVAKRVVERSPEATIDNFVASWASRDVETDSLARRADRDAVTLATPASVVGREFRAVVVAGVNDGAWPNLRLRDSLLGAQRLVEVVTSRADDTSTVDRRRDVLDDESRMFAQALSRAREWLLVTAVDSDDTAPSVLFRRLDAPRLDPTRRHLPSTLRSLTAALRRDLRSHAITGRPATAEAAALARLAAADVPGAHPDAWHGLRAPSTTRTLVDVTGGSSVAGGEPDPISVSPSQIERFEACGIDWFVARHGGGDSSVEMGLGTLVHEGAEFSFASPAARSTYLSAKLAELRPEAPWRATAIARRLDSMLGALDDYVDERRAEGVAVLGAERPFVVDVPVESDGVHALVRLRGMVDRIEAAPEHGVRIVDFKTSKTAIAKAEAESNAQLAAYQFAARRARIGEPRDEPHDDDPAPRVDPGGPIEVAPDQLEQAALVYLGRGKVDLRTQDAMSDAAEAEFEHRLVRAALGMAGLRMRDDGTLTPVVPGAPASYATVPELHCEAEYGGSKACRIHIIAEVTE